MPDSAALLSAFRRVAAPGLRAAGFVGRGGHWVRRTGAITHVVELQTAVLGGRVTANLGLDLEWLPPVVGWLGRPALGAHAHDATRWIRIGLTLPERTDRWWALEVGAPGAGPAVEGLAEALARGGLPWLEREGSAEAFVRHARALVERSMRICRSEAGFDELRLLAAALAWSGRAEEAAAVTERAARQWPGARAQLDSARALHARRHPDRDVPPVPDLLAALEGLIASTTDDAPWARGARAAPRSRSGRPR